MKKHHGKYRKLNIHKSTVQETGIVKKTSEIILYWNQRLVNETGNAKTSEIRQEVKD